MDLRADSNLGKIMSKEGEDIELTNIFSDFVCRINSLSERKVRIIAITSTCITKDKARSSIFLFPRRKAYMD